VIEVAPWFGVPVCGGGGDAGSCARAQAAAATTYNPAATAWRTDTMAAMNTAVMVRLDVGCEDVDMATSSGEVPSGGSAPASRALVKQSFWSHQLTEYVLGAVVLTQGLGGGVRVVPIVAGTLVIVLAATADGPLAMVKLVPRPLHRIADIASALVLTALSIVLREESGTFAMMVGLGCAAALLFLVARTDYRPPTRRGLFGRAATAASPSAQRDDAGSSTGTTASAAQGSRSPARSEQIGRTAGRLAGRAARAAVDRTKGDKGARS